MIVANIICNPRRDEKISRGRLCRLKTQLPSRLRQNPALWFHPLIGQEASLSRWKSEFESPWNHHRGQHGKNIDVPVTNPAQVISMFLPGITKLQRKLLLLNLRIGREVRIQLDTLATGVQIQISSIRTSPPRDERGAQWEGSPDLEISHTFMVHYANWQSSNREENFQQKNYHIVFQRLNLILTKNGKKYDLGDWRNW